jgi:hypothetical protein
MKTNSRTGAPARDAICQLAALTVEPVSRLPTHKRRRREKTPARGANDQDKARQASPYAIQRLIQLMDSEDERVAAVACNAILDRAFGKPKGEGNQQDILEVRIANMTREERVAGMRELLEPMRAHLHDTDDGREAEAEVGAKRQARMGPSKLSGRGGAAPPGA